MPVMMTMMRANTFLTYAEVDHAGNDDDDESEHFGEGEDVLDSSCPFHVPTVYKRQEC